KEGSFASSLTNGAAFNAEFVDVADQNDGSLNGDAEECEQSEETGNAERGVSKLQGNQSADRLGEHNTERNGNGKFEISVEREKNHENQKYGERADEIELRLGLKEFAVFTAPFHAVTLG